MYLLMMMNSIRLSCHVINIWFDTDSPLISESSSVCYLADDCGIKEKEEGEELVCW